MKLLKYLSLAIISTISLWSCQISSSESNATQNIDSLRIVSLNGTVSEILCAVGLEKQIVGTDVASTYPESLRSVPKVGHNRKIPVEAVLALKPNLIVGTVNEIPKETVEQFRQAGVRMLLLDQEYSVEGSRSLIKNLTDSLKIQHKGDSILKSFDQEFALSQQLKSDSNKPKVLFIYARGAGTMMVGGLGTQVDKMIELASGENAVRDFHEYKPLTAESLVKYNPDVILLFSSGLASLGDEKGLLEVQGVQQTNAGKRNKIVSMDGQLLSGFSPRLPLAIQELHTKIHQ